IRIFERGAFVTGAFSIAIRETSAATVGPDTSLFGLLFVFARAFSTMFMLHVCQTFAAMQFIPHKARHTDVPAFDSIGLHTGAHHSGEMNDRPRGDMIIAEVDSWQTAGIAPDRQAQTAMIARQLDDNIPRTTPFDHIPHRLF